MVRILFAKTAQAKKSMKKKPKQKHYEDIYNSGLQIKHIDLDKEINVNVDENIQKQYTTVKMSEMTEYMMEYLVNKYKDDFKAMEVDLELNPLQYSAKKLEYYYNRYINLGKQVEKKCNSLIPKQEEQQEKQIQEVKTENIEKMKRIAQLQKQFQ